MRRMAALMYNLGKMLERGGGGGVEMHIDGEITSPYQTALSACEYGKVHYSLP